MFIKQYEIWQTCNNNCDFCFNKGFANKIFPNQQEQSLRCVLKDLDKVVEEHGGDLSIELIGGEFFQGQLSTQPVRELFFELITKLRHLADKNLVNQIVIFVTLTLGEQEDLYKALNILMEDKTSKCEVWVSTSYDTRGRFGPNNEKLDNWKKHMLKLSEIKGLFKNTTIIFTQAFCDEVLSGKFDFINFQETYGTTLFFKHPLPLLINSYYINETDDQRQVYINAKNKSLEDWKWFMPKRSDAIQVMAMMNNVGILDRLMGLDYRADDLDSKFEDGEWVKTIRDKEHKIESRDEEKNSCGHLLTYMCYSDSNECLLCDKETLLSDD